MQIRSAMEILYQDNDWIAVNKPIGVSGEAKSGELPDVLTWLALYHGQSQALEVVLPLAADDSGVMVLAKHGGAVHAARGMVSGVEPKRGDLMLECVFLSPVDSRKAAGWSSREADVAGSEQVIEISRESGGVKTSHYRARLPHGAANQLRAVCARLGVPILGDGANGGKAFPRVCLHRHRVSWPGIGELVAPLPLSFSPAQEKTNPQLTVSCDRRLRFYSGITTAFRALHRGELAALDCAVDVYGDFLCAWVYNAQLATGEVIETLKPIMAFLIAHYGARGWVLKRANRNPHARQLVGELHLFGESPPAFYTVTEHGLSYRVTLTHSQHAGLFLDQRDNRQRVLLASAGKRVANLFAYTGSFSLAAVAAGAEVAFSVDIAKPALDWAKLNFELNGLHVSGRGKFVQEEAVNWLNRQLRKRAKDGEARPFDLIICDPPTFSTSKTGGRFSVAAQWDELAHAGAALLHPQHGEAFFSTNYREEPASYFHRLLSRHFSQVERLAPPLDFPALPGSPETVKLFRCRMV